MFLFFFDDYQFTIRGIFFTEAATAALLI